jgi:flagellum-specific peptidoglycan hydrolase FlgJ
LCKLFNIDPKGTVQYNGVKVPTILCHYDSYKLGLGSNHGDIYHWFPKHDKNMETARNDVAALMRPIAVKTYEVVTPISKYTTAADAVNQKNAKSDKLAAGTYYIYTKYPDGVQGMYNISTNKTGTVPGSWINPKENVLKEPSADAEPKKLYRVRKAKNDHESQIGAYYELQNAINACQSAGPGYFVFDSDDNVVYSYVAPAEKVPNTGGIIAVYDLVYPEKTKIITSDIKRTNTDCVKAIKKILESNDTFDPCIVKAFFTLAPKYGIDPMMAIAQSILETGWFKYVGSAVTAEQHNYCGLGVTTTGIKGASFNSIEDGVTAQLQHLYAYGCKEAIPADDKLLDPRFNLVTRGIAPYWQQLAGRWAVPGYDKKTYSTPQKAMEANNTYGQKIRTIYNQLVATTITNEDIEALFKEEIEEPKADDNIIALIIDCIKKLIEFLTVYLTKKDV